MSEQQEYETVWSGAAWRDVPYEPPPEMPKERPTVPPMPLTERIAAAVSDEWLMVREIADRAGCCTNGVVCTIVGRLFERGRLERMPSDRPGKGRRGFLYRKVQA